MQTNNKKSLSDESKHSPFVLPDGRYLSSEFMTSLLEVSADDGPHSHILDLGSLQVRAVLSSEVREGMLVVPRASQAELRKILHGTLEFFAPFPGDSEESIQESQSAAKMLAQLLEDDSLSVKEITGRMNQVHPYQMGAWDQGRNDYLYALVEDWFTVAPISAVSNLDYWFDDDCACCQYLRSAEEGWTTATLEGTKQAFVETNKKNPGWLGTITV
ncbi:hypothetical protein HY627_02050 [Candidatus Uhrbacteria bacterium]|nr:hypothetical protein [Candidatus Uhrbacteria bacterium]